MRAAGIAAVVATIAVTGFVVSGRTTATERPGSAAAQPHDCGVVAATRAAEAFVTAMNRGTRRELAAFVGPEFVAYSIREGDPGAARFVSFGRRDVVPSLLVRQRSGERHSLLVVEVNERFGKSRAGLSFVLTRRGPELRRLGITHGLGRGKGEISCHPRRVVVWNISMPRTTRLEDCGLIACPCPLPRAWNRRTAIVACATGGRRVRLLPRTERR
jgi:hypothetical protein